MSQPQEMAGARQDPGTETWTYGGIRVGKNGKRWHAWLDQAGTEHWFSGTGSHMAVGSRYTAQVSRHDGTLTLHGTPDTPAPRLIRTPGAPCGPSTPLPRPGSRPCALSGTPPAATPWTRRSRRCWNWPPRCAPQRSAAHSRPASSASSTTPGAPGDPGPRAPARPAGGAGRCPRREGDGIAVDIATRAGPLTVVSTSVASASARPAGTAFSYRGRHYTGSVYLAGPSWRGTPGPGLSVTTPGPGPGRAGRCRRAGQGTARAGTLAA